MKNNNKFDMLTKAIHSVKSKGYVIDESKKRNGTILNISKPGREYIEQEFDNQLGVVFAGANKTTYR